MLRPLTNRCFIPLLRSTRFYSTPTAPTTSRTLILALESSADDTCASILSSTSTSTSPSFKHEILSNIVMKQPIHETYGGIHPMLAGEAHGKAMPVAIARALGEAGVTLEQVDAFAFTRGPGMYGCLTVCAGAAKALAAATNKPIVGVHHMQAHALTPFLTEKDPPTFPYLTLLVSGGHTMLVLARSVSDFEIMASTSDESIGASLDKVSRDLKIPWGTTGSAGAALSHFAFPPSSSSSDKTSHSTSPFTSKFPLPLRGKLEFSFAGLRSSLSRQLRNEVEQAEIKAHFALQASGTNDPREEDKFSPIDEGTSGGLDISEEAKGRLARGFWRAAVGQVEEKVGLAFDKLKGEGVECLVVSGGVAANSYLRERLRWKLDNLGHTSTRLIFPPPALCTDNAAMIAYVAHSRLERGRSDGIDVMQVAKWSIEECEADFEIREEEA